MRRWLWLMGVFVWAGLLQAQDRTEVKPDGTRITTHQVPLLNKLPTACVALESKGGLATIVIPADELHRLATRDEKALEGKISRMDFLASGRARDLLKLLSTERDSRGCQEIRGQLPLDTTYLIGWLLEQGHAEVFTHHLNLPEPFIIVRHINTPIFGTEEFLLQDGTEIWGYGTWVS